MFFILILLHVILPIFCLQVLAVPIAKGNEKRGRKKKSLLFIRDGKLAENE